MLFAQGPWTPWQMFSMGMIGFLAGILFGKGFFGAEAVGSLCVFGGLSAILIYGGIMNSVSALMWARRTELEPSGGIFSLRIPDGLRSGSRNLAVFVVCRRADAGKVGSNQDQIWIAISWLQAFGPLLSNRSEISAFFRRYKTTGDFYTPLLRCIKSPGCAVNFKVWVFVFFRSFQFVLKYRLETPE